MTSAEQLRVLWNRAERHLSQGQLDLALYSVLTVLDVLITEKEAKAA